MTNVNISQRSSILFSLIAISFFAAGCGQSAGLKNSAATGTSLTGTSGQYDPLSSAGNVYTGANGTGATNGNGTGTGMGTGSGTNGNAGGPYGYGSGSAFGNGNPMGYGPGHIIFLPSSPSAPSGVPSLFTPAAPGSHSVIWRWIVFNGEANDYMSSYSTNESNYVMIWKMKAYGDLESSTYRAIYRCYWNSGHYDSMDYNCENAPGKHLDGIVYFANTVQHANEVPIYRCLINPSNGGKQAHVTVYDPATCLAGNANGSKNVVEGILGYVPPLF